MKIIELAIKHGDYSVEHGINGVQFTNKELQAFAQAFAQAVIEGYKASLVPVVWMHDTSSHIKDISIRSDTYHNRPLYALPSGETK